VNLALEGRGAEQRDRLVRGPVVAIGVDLAPQDARDATVSIEADLGHGVGDHWRVETRCAVSTQAFGQEFAFGFMTHSRGSSGGRSSLHLLVHATGASDAAS